MKYHAALSCGLLAAPLALAQATIWIPTEDGVDAFEDVDVKVEALGAGKDEDGKLQTTYRIEAEFTGNSASDEMADVPFSTEVTWVQGASHGRVDQIVETTMSDEYYGEAYQSIHYVQDCDGQVGGPVTCVNGGMQRMSAADEAIDTTITHPDITTTISAQALTTIAAEDEDSGAAGMNSASSMMFVVAAGLGYVIL